MRWKLIAAIISVFIDLHGNENINSQRGSLPMLRSLAVDRGQCSALSTGVRSSNQVESRKIGAK